MRHSPTASALDRLNALIAENVRLREALGKCFDLASRALAEREIEPATIMAPALILVQKYAREALEGKS